MIRSIDERLREILAVLQGRFVSPWLSYEEASAYSGLSVRTLRRAARDPDRPLPVRYVSDRVLIHRDDLDSWLRSAPTSRRPEAIAEGIITDLRSKQKTATAARPAKEAAVARPKVRR